MVHALFLPEMKTTTSHQRWRWVFLLEGRLSAKGGVDGEGRLLCVDERVKRAIRVFLPIQIHFFNGLNIAYSNALANDLSTNKPLKAPADDLAATNSIC
ncbi:hypothetical protein L1887_22999 [Cichorium endivia]|nr:hypothetical protein L1887_22999 [Cichorium endivia]